MNQQNGTFRQWLFGIAATLVTTAIIASAASNVSQGQQIARLEQNNLTLTEAIRDLRTEMRDLRMEIRSLNQTLKTSE